MIDRLLVPISVIKDLTSIEAAVEASRLRSSVLTAQRIHLQNVLGSSLFKFMLTKVQDDGTLSGLTLVQEQLYAEFITPLLAHYSDAEFVVAGNFKRSNAGTVRGGEKVEGASLEEIKYLQKGALNNADFYAQRLKVFICSDEVKSDPIHALYLSDHQNLAPANNVQQSFIYTGPRR